MRKAVCLALLFFPEILLGYPRIKNPQNPNEVQINFNDVSDEIGRVQSSCLTSSSATATYLSTITAANTYLSNSSVTATYLQLSSASATYLTKSSATATYLQLSSASATYLQPSVAANTYLTKSSATATYQQLTDSIAATRITGTLPIVNGGTGLTKKMIEFVTYTGDGSASHSVNHGLAAVPDFIFIIRLDNSAMDVPVILMPGMVSNYSRFTNGVGNDFNSILGADSTTFTVGTHNSVNANGKSYGVLLVKEQ